MSRYTHAGGSLFPSTVSVDHRRTRRLAIGSKGIEDCRLTACAIIVQSLPTLNIWIHIEFPAPANANTTSGPRKRKTPYQIPPQFLKSENSHLAFTGRRIHFF